MLTKSKTNSRAKIFLILHNIRSAYNVGSIFRTADGAGVSKIYLCGYTPSPCRNCLDVETKSQSDSRDSRSTRLGATSAVGRKIAKTALGAEKYVPWEQCKQTWRLLEKIKKDGVHVVALEQSPKAVDYRKFKQPLGNGVSKWLSMALILGNEVGGLSKKILKYCDEIIEIPMRGKKESLNVSVAAGIALYRII